MSFKLGTTARLAERLLAPGLLAALLACGDTTKRSVPQGLALVSGLLPVASDCNGAPQSGVNYRNAEVEPFVAADPTSPGHLVGVWQQDRWSNGGANSVGAATSFDGGKTWSGASLRLSRCGGGSAANGGDYERASDPWVTIAADGTAHAISLSFNNSTPAKAILAARSLDGGRTWSDPIALATDNSVDFALDKESITADPKDPKLVYAVWDRLTGQRTANSPSATGPAWFARSTDAGASWEMARPIFDPGQNAQTIGNQIAVLPDGTLLDVFALITSANLTRPPTQIALIRSSDKGVTWSAPVVFSDTNNIGTLDPKTGQPVRTGGVLPGVAVDKTSGAVYVVWQDARASGGLRDGVALAKSTDGGLSFAPSIQVNQVPTAQAFVPSIALLADGTIGVTYYDFRRDDPGDASSLLASLWLATSRDGGASWQEAAIGPAFDLRKAPVVGGLFLGDYQGLAASGASFVPFFVLTNPDAGNPTDVFARPAGSLPTALLADAPRFIERAPRRSEAYRFGTRF